MARPGLSSPAPSAHLCARVTATWRAQEAFGSSAVAHWPVEVTPVPRPKAQQLRANLHSWHCRNHEPRNQQHHEGGGQRRAHTGSWQD